MSDHGAVFRFNGDGYQAGFALLQYFTAAGNRTAGSDAGDENVDLTVGIAPDFFGSRHPMDFRIGRVAELLRHEIVGIRLRQLGSLANGTRHAFTGRCQDDFCAPAP